MALTAAHLNAGHSGGDSVAIGIYSPSSPTSIPPSPPFSPSLISLMVSVDVKHHVYLLTTDRLEERGVERGSARRSSLKGRERAIINQTNIGTVSKAALEKLLREAHMGFSERIHTILNWTEVFLQMTKLIIEVVYGARNALLLYTSYYFSSLIIIQVSSSGDPVRITGL